MSHREIDDNNPAADSAVAFLFVVIPFGLMFLVGLQWIAGLPILGDAGHGADHAAAAEH